MRWAPRTRRLAVLGWSARVLAAGLACMSLSGSLGVAAAVALPADGNGNYTQILCADPATGDGVGITGMPEGLTNPASTVDWQITTSQVDCGAGAITAGRGIPMAVGQGNTYPQGTWAALLYQAPPTLTINGAVFYRAEQAAGANNGFMGINQQGGDYTSLYALPRNSVDQGDWFAGNITARGTFASPFSAANLVNATISPDGGHWDVNAACDPNGNNNSSCTLAAGQWEYRIFGGAVSLNAVNDPQASNITGPMTTDTPLRGAEPVTFSATDEGPGLAYVKLIVDGSTLQSETIDTNNGRCVPVVGHDAYTWAYQVPCKTSVGGRTYTLDTAALSDGTHHIQVVIEDAAGNQSVVVDRSTTTHNAPVDSAAPAIGAASAPQVGAPLAAQTGTWEAPPGAGALSYAYQWQDCDAAGQGCSNIAAANNVSYSPTAEDAGQTLRVLVTAADQDGLTTVPSSASAAVAGSASMLSAALGPANGFGASPSARIVLAGSRTIARSYAQRALRLSGMLLGGDGQPVRGATLDILEQRAGGSATVIGHAVTVATGAFSARVAPGPSRSIEVAYRAYGGEPAYSAQAAVRESVAANVSLAVTPKRVGGAGTISLSGRVSGPIPPQGVVVELLVYYRGQWEPFRDPRTSHSGWFHVRYHFEGAIGRFPFRAEVFGGQQAFPYVTGTSRAVAVSSD